MPKHIRSLSGKAGKLTEVMLVAENYSEGLLGLIGEACRLRRLGPPYAYVDLCLLSVFADISRFPLQAGQANSSTLLTRRTH